jgi:hypothetical protein
VSGSVGDAYTRNTEQFIEQSFAESPNYKVIQIDGVDVEVRVLDEKSTSNSVSLLSFAKSLLFKPGATIKRGSYAVIDSDNWLIVDVEKSLLPKAKILLCNTTFNIQTGTDEVIAGFDALDRPIINKTPIYTQYPCAVDNNIQNLNINAAINNPDGVITILVANNQYVANDMDFNMWNEHYKVIGINRALIVGSDGVLIVTAKRQA